MGKTPGVLDMNGVNWKIERERPMLPPDIDQIDHTK